MDFNSELVPSVVAVVVVHEPGPQFQQVLDSLAEQDYANLKTLFLVVGEAAEVSTAIHATLPDAFVRPVLGNPGFGAVANEVLHLVEGDNGFFLLMHDDVALESTGVRQLVEELYRSNAGIVGPKLVLWDRPGILQHVGLGVDRFGEVDPLVEPGEADQEQHDAVRDVFALPSACLLVRADLFRTLGGFDPSTSFHGEDVDLCWRAHLSGARVVVVPSAKARHQERLTSRHPDLPHLTLAARHRVRSVATLTGGLRLPLVLVQMLLLCLAEIVVGLFTGRLGEAFASLRATLGIVPRIGSIIRRRREVARLREVPYREVAGLQIRGSARLASYLRTREQLHMSVDQSAIGARRFSRNTAGQIAAWMAVIILALIGSRTFILDGVPRIGQFLSFPESTRTLLGDYWSGWWGHGLGQTVAAPTGIGVLGVAGIASIGHMALLQTVAVLAWLPIGYYGAWKLMSIFPSSRARIVGLVAFAAVPLPYTALAAGRWGVVVAYGSLPWVVHLMRKLARIEPALSARAEADVPDEYSDATLRQMVRWGAQLALLTGAVTAFVPTFAGLVFVVGVALALASLVARSSPWTVLTLTASGIGAALVGLLINLPWLTSLFGANGWDTFVGAPAVATDGVGLSHILRFAVGRDRLGPLAIALWLPVIAAPLLARGWRLTWAARAGVLAVVALILAGLGQRGSLPFRLPETGILLAPAAVGLVLAAACAAAAFEQDVQGGSFGWRQPLGVLCGAALVLGAIPSVAASANGRWSTPTDTIPQPSDQYATDPADGDSRSLYIGDARAMPIEGWRLDDRGESGVTYTIVDDGPLDIRELWPGRPSREETEVRDVLALLSGNSTARIGRLLAPYSIRFVIVPLIDAVDSTSTEPLPRPRGLIETLTAQLDLRRLITPTNYIVFENTAWIPTRAALSASAALASNEAGEASLANDDIGGSIPLFVGMPDRGPGSSVVPAGVVYSAVPFDGRWSLDVDGNAVTPRVAFGSTLAFDVAEPGVATLSYRTDTSRRVAVIAQLIAWIVLLGAASNVRLGWLRRRRRLTDVDDGPVLSLGMIEPGAGGLFDPLARPGLHGSAGPGAGQPPSIEAGPADAGADGFPAEHAGPEHAGPEHAGSEHAGPEHAGPSPELVIVEATAVEVVPPDEPEPEILDDVYGPGPFQLPEDRS